VSNHTLFGTDIDHFPLESFFFKLESDSFQYGK
jgi:hypothetical protein